MQHFTLKKGTTSKILQIDIYDSSSTVGARLAGLVYNSAGLVAYYNREGAAGAATAITLDTATKGTWATSGFIAIDATNMPGHYELHIPDAALATGANSVIVELRGATNMVPKTLLIELVDNVEADTYTRLGAPAGASVSADVAAVKTDTGAIKVKTDYLPSATAGATGGVFIAGANAATSITTALTANVTGNVSGSVGSVTGAVGSVTADVGVTQAGADKVWLTASRTLTGFSTALALSIWDVLESAILTASSIGLKVKNNLDATVSSRVTPAQVNTEVVDALNTDTYAEPGQEVPPATTTLVKKIGYLYKALRNKFTQDATTAKLYADDATTVDQKATVSDDGTTYTRGEMETGP